MISREPTVERLATAQALMLEPFGLSEASLQQALGLILEHRVDDADLYFQTTRHEGWSLEEGIVKSGSFSIDQGVGVRAVAGEKTAFAYSDDLSEASLLDAARTVRTIAAAGQQRRIKLASKAKVAGSRRLYGPTDPILTLDSAQKVSLLSRVEQMARAKDPRIVQVMASVAAEHDVVLVARADGTRAADVRPLVRVSVTVIAEQNGRREVGSGGGGGRFGLGYFTDDVLASYVQQAATAALTNLDSRPAPAGQMTVVLGPGWPGVLLHEAVGHGLEGDFNRKGSSTFSGRIGQRESYAHVPMPRMTNTYMLGGDRSADEIVASIKRGLYASNFGGGQVDITSGKFVFSASEAFWVENGKIQYPVKGATIIGNGPEALKRVTMIGNDMRLDTGVGVCGKEGQSVPVGVGQPTLRIEGLTVGGTA